MGGSSSSPTIGHKIYVGMQMALCHGPIDKITQILVDKRVAWSGDATGGALEISAKKLFGGEKNEGGVSGTVDFDFGWDDQTENTYLQSQLGTAIPAFRGVVCAVLNQCYVGMNPYLKPWAFRAQRIHITDGGELDSNGVSNQWYDAKAAVFVAGSHLSVEDTITTSLGPTSAGWRYKIVDLTDTADYSDPNIDDSGWLNGELPFADEAPHPYAVANGFPAIKNTNWPLETAIWVRKTLHLSAIADIEMDILADNFIWVWVNGVMLVNGVNATQTKHSFQIPSSLLNIGINSIVFKGADDDVVSPDDYTYLSCKVASVAFLESQQAHYDMNPAHIIRECLTNTNWGMGYLGADIDDDAFAYAADLLYAESMGISLLWDRSVPLDDFISDILRHIDAVLYVSRSTGKFVLKLIRDDYGSDTIVLDASNIIDISIKRPTIGELTNSVSVIYWDYITDEDASLTIHNQALMQMQGSEVAAKIQYPGFSNSAIAARVASRDLKALSTPLLSCEITTTRAAEILNIGDVFVLDWPQLEVYDTVMRVSSIEFGDGIDNSIKITALEDVFSIPDFAAVSGNAESWDDPLNAEPDIALPRIVTELPYYSLVRDRGQLAADTILADDSDAGFLAVLAGRQGAEVNANLLVDAGAGYVDKDVLDFAGYATLDIDINHTDSQVYYTAGVDLEDVNIGSILQIDDELMRVDSFGSDSNGSFVSVGRGVLDTVPTIHVVDSNISYLIFWDNNISSDEVQYIASDIVSVKIQTTTGANILDESLAPIDSVTFDSRAIRPYPPSNVKINDQQFPTIVEIGDVTISWGHRDRTQQTGDYLIDFYDANIGPEAGVTYTIRLYNEYDELSRSVSGITGTSYTWSTEVSDSLVFDAAAGAYTETILGQVASAYWRLSESGATTVDLIGSNDITFPGSGVTKAQSSILSNSENSSLLLDGTSNLSITSASGSWLPTGNNDRSVYIWFSTTSAADTDDHGVFGYGANVTRQAFNVRLARSSETPNVNNKIVVWAYGDDLTVDTGVNLRDGNAHMIAVTYKGSTKSLKLYLDGTLAGSKTLGADLATPTTSNMYIGKNTLGSPFVGYLQEVSIFAAEKTSTNVLDAFNSSSVSGVYRRNSRIRLELETHKSGDNSNGYTSWQIIDHEFFREVDSNYDSDFGS